MEWKTLRQIIQKSKVLARAQHGSATCSVWCDLFAGHILEGMDSTDDMLFYVKQTTPQLDGADTILDVYRIHNPQKPVPGNKRYSWEETFYLNLLLHQFNYVMTCAVCEQKKPGKDLKVYRSFSVPVYSAPNKHSMSGKAKLTTISYPNIYFSVFNFEEIFDGIVLTDNEMVCVELVAIDRAQTVQISVFLGSIKYEVLKNTLETRASFKTKILKQVSLGLYSGDQQSQFITMNGPKGRGRVEMSVSTFKPDINKDFVVSFDREADLLDTDTTSSKQTSSYASDSRRLSSNTKQRYISNNWAFRPTPMHHYVNAQLTYLTLRWDELLDDLIECKKKPVLYRHVD